MRVRVRVRVRARVRLSPISRLDLPYISPDQAAHTSYLGANQSYLTSGTAAALQLPGSVMQSKGTGRAQTRSPTSRYRLIPTENLKFQKFIDLIYSSKMTPDE